MGAQALHELYLSKKESPQVNPHSSSPIDFTAYSLEDVEQCFLQIELVSFQEKKFLNRGETGVVVKAISSGNSVGGCAWHLGFNHLTVIYAMDLNDKETPVSQPMQPFTFKGANLMITNGFSDALPNQIGSKVLNYVNEEKLRNRLEEVCVDH